MTVIGKSQVTKHKLKMLVGYNVGIFIDLSFQQLRRFASMDESKNDDDDLIINDADNRFSMYGDIRSNVRSNESSSYANGKRLGNDGYFYSSSPTHLGSGNGNRTLPQPPRSLPMTPSSAPSQPPSRMSFIPSKPFNNFMHSQQQQQEVPTLSSSAPAPTSSRPPFMAMTSTSASTSLANPSTASSVAYRGQQQRQNSFTSSSSSVRRNQPPDPVPKSKIVSPYIVSIESSHETDNGYFTPTESPTSPDQLSTSSDPHGSKFSRMPQPRYRQQPPPAPQKRPGTT